MIAKATYGFHYTDALTTCTECAGGVYSRHLHKKTCANLDKVGFISHPERSYSENSIE